jgi:hypothetical protein
MQGMREEMGNIYAELNSMRAEMANMRDDMRSMRDEIRALSTKVLPDGSVQCMALCAISGLLALNRGRGRLQASRCLRATSIATVASRSGAPSRRLGSSRRGRAPARDAGGRVSGAGHAHPAKLVIYA